MPPLRRGRYKGMPGPDVAIVDYRMGNMFSVKHACEYVGLNPFVTSNSDEITSADGIILPGVGAFGDAMENLRKLDLISPIMDYIESGKPFMGICLGMQLLMTESEEFGRHNGLDVIKGSVVKFPLNGNGDMDRVKVPQVGWNRIERPDCRAEDLWAGTPLAGVANGEFMYFVHSYYAMPADADAVLTVTEYGPVRYCSGVRRGNVFAFQFHPEKSAMEGMRIYKNWAAMIKARE